MSGDISKSHKNRESAEKLFMIAEELAEAGKYDEALTTCDQVIAEFSNSQEISIRETVVRTLTGRALILERFPPDVNLFVQMGIP